MKQQTAETVANLVVGAAVLGAAYVVVRTPALRRLAWGLAVAAVTRQAPAWLRREIGTAWTDSASRARAPQAGT